MEFLKPQTTSPAGFADRILRPFSDVRPGEGMTALLLSANVFVLLAAYYVLKTVRESLILSEGGAEVKSYSSAGQALLLLAVIPMYGMMAARVGRMKLITGVNLFFISNLTIFYFLGISGFRVGIAFYLWLGIFNVLVIAQFWAFANDVYRPEQGQRLFPIVGVGSSLGAWFGSGLAARIFASFRAYELMLIAAAGLLVSVILTHIVHLRVPEKASKGKEKNRLSKKGGFQLVFSDRYLFLMAIMIVLLNVVNTTGEYILSKMVVQSIPVAATQLEQQEIIGEFYGSFYSWVNFCGLMFQLFLVSRIFRLGGVRGALFILPCVSFLGYGFISIMPVLAFVRIAKILENSTDYSIQNTTRQALFLPTTRDAKYKAKAAIDTFFWRAGDVLQAIIVFAGTQIGLVIRNYATINTLFVLIWILVSVAIFHEHKKKMEADASAPDERVA
jgi:AAA family ATP:ADP antiporter